VATVFGATGFSGRYVVELLANVGAQIVIPFRGEDKCYAHLKTVGELGQVVPVRIDVRDKASLERAVSRSNVVINLMGREWETRNFKYDDVNRKAAIDIAEVSKHVERYVHVGAAGVSTNSDNAWEKSKAEGEEAVRKLLPWATIMKPTIMFGDEDRLLNKYGIMCQYWPIIPMCAKEAKIQPMDAIDLGNAVVAALGSARTIGKTYVLGGPETYTWEELIQKIIAGTKRPKTIKEFSISNMTKFANIIQHMALEPLFVPEEVRHHAKDIVVAPKELSFKDLGITPASIDQMLTRITRAYRHPNFVSELVEAAPPIQRY
jgi:NADH dehydrogenase (ubiquinone) 1 alpha subcomplex subunit 9